MNFYKFTNSDGSLLAYINMNHVISAQPNDDGTMKIYTLDSDSLDVSAQQFEKAVNMNTSQDMAAVIRRLCDAVNKLTFRIPTSIRMRM